MSLRERGLAIDLSFCGQKHAEADNTPNCESRCEIFAVSSPACVLLLKEVVVKPVYLGVLGGFVLVCSTFVLVYYAELTTPHALQCLSRLGVLF